MNDEDSELEEMRKKWLGDLSGLSEKWPEELKAGLGRYVDGMMKDAFDPEKFMDFIRRSGVDFIGFTSVARSQATSDPYRILGLDKSASDEDVKKRYRELIRKFHPDSAGVAGTEFMFQLAMTAYEAIKRERGWT